MVLDSQFLLSVLEAHLSLSELSLLLNKCLLVLIHPSPLVKEACGWRHSVVLLRCWQCLLVRHHLCPCFPFAFAFTLGAQNSDCKFI